MKFFVNYNICLLETKILGGNKGETMGNSGRLSYDYDIRHLVIFSYFDG